VKAPWPGDRCILCLRQTQLTEEHIIPKSLGGRLTCVLLCDKCNSTLGARWEAAARSDPSIRIAVENLAYRFPALATKLRANQTYMAHTKAGTVRGFMRRSGFRAFSKKENDGSLSQPTDEARRTVETILRKSGYGPAPLQEALRLFDDAPDDRRIQIAPGLEMGKWSVKEIQPDLSKPLMDPVVPLKMAYEFLTCHLGTAVYDEAPQIEEVRQVLRGRGEPDLCCRVDRLRADAYEPLHGLCFEGNNPHATVQICLFGWLRYEVHFLRLAVVAPRHIYTHDLEHNVEYLRMAGKNGGAQERTP